MTKKVEDWADEQMKDPEFKSAFEDLFDEHQAERLSVMFSDILRFQCDEDGTYIVDDYKTTTYGDGETPLEALRDYIVSLIDLIEIILKSQSRWEKIAIENFVYKAASVPKRIWNAPANLRDRSPHAHVGSWKPE